MRGFCSDALAFRRQLMNWSVPVARTPHIFFKLFSVIPRINIITRTKDRPVFLARALHCMAAQTFPDWHLILVDQGDLELTRNVLASVPGMMGRVTHIQAPAGIRIGAMSNLGIRAGDADLICMLDDDDTWHPEYLERMEAALRNRPSDVFAGVACHTLAVEEELGPDGRWITVHENSKTPFGQITILDILRRPIFQIHAFLYERRCHDVIGYLNEDMPSGDDWDFHCRFVQKFDIMVLADELARYHKRPQTATGTAANSKHSYGRMVARYTASSKANRDIRQCLEADPERLGIFSGLAVLERNLSRRLMAMEERLASVQAELALVSEKVGKVNARSKLIKDAVVK